MDAIRSTTSMGTRSDSCKDRVQRATVATVQKSKAKDYAYTTSTTCCCPRREFQYFFFGCINTRGAKFSKALCSGIWSEDLCLIHELARRRPDHLQRAYLAITTNRGGATAHKDTHDGSTTILGFGPEQ
eukprot:5111116-Amphidinium_carterae.6